MNSILRPLKLSYFLFLISYSLFSCSISKQISKQADSILLNDTAISQGHIGISIYEPATGKYWYNYNADKYFIPASNTKLFTLYAGMKYLGDSLVGLRYNNTRDNNITYIDPTGDPTFLHPDFIKQPVFEFLQKQSSMIINRPAYFNVYGKGWAWEDHTESFMIPRSSFPIYGNLVNIKWIKADSLLIYPKYFYKEIEKSNRFPNGFDLIKQFGNNHLMFLEGEEKKRAVPFEADISTVIDLLKDTLKNKTITSNVENIFKEGTTIHSQPSDSLFKLMIHNSDNFFAEQTLLMASNERLGYMSDEDMIDTVLNNDLKDVPQKPRWVDGSGLSRYNLFTPRSFVYILEKMKNEFGLGRLEIILPTGGEGTLKNYFIADSSYIYAKTGTLSNNSSLSGFLVTGKGKLLIFSILANNYQTGSGPVRRAVEHFLSGIRKKY
ncbi:MAG: D-alanyl-D-alanine carboxypeptidase [Ferruginibacter sp.]